MPCAIDIGVFQGAQRPIIADSESLPRMYSEGIPSYNYSIHYMYISIMPCIYIYIYTYIAYMCVSNICLYIYIYIRIYFYRLRICTYRFNVYIYILLIYICICIYIYYIYVYRERSWFLLVMAQKNVSLEPPSILELATGEVHHVVAQITILMLVQGGAP